MRKIMTLLVGLAITPVAAGCGSLADEYCDQKCACENCSDRKFDQCKIEYEAQMDVASTYGCDVQFEDVHQCVVVDRDNVCLFDHFGPDIADCGGRLDDLSDCIKQNSAIQ